MKRRNYKTGLKGLSINQLKMRLNRAFDNMMLYDEQKYLIRYNYIKQLLDKKESKKATQ